MTAVRKIIQFPSRPRQRREYETAFLPAALEVVETPPSPIGRAIGLTIILLFCAALMWASLGKVDVVATAPGRIVVSGRTKVIQPAETGVVRAIHVRDGTTVKAGDVLIELDPTINVAELDHVKSDLIAAELDTARLRAAIASDIDPIADFTPPAGASQRLVEMYRQLLASQKAEHAAKLAEIDRQLAQKDAERETIVATIAKLDATIPLLQERVDVRKYLYDKAIGTKIIYLTEFQDLVGQQHDVLVQQSRLREAEAAVAGLAQARFKVEAEYRRTLYEDLAKSEQRAAGLAQDVIKGEQKAKQRDSHRTGRWRRATIGGAHDRWGRDASSDARSRGTAQLQPRDRGDDLEPRYRLRRPRTERRDQDRYLQFHPLRAARWPRAQHFARCHHTR